MNTEVMFSSNDHDWETPQELFNNLNDEFHFTLDPCASISNHKCEMYYTEEMNGLSLNWKGYTVFINPPYGREQKVWIKKAYKEFMDNDVTSVLLIPSRTDTAIFHDIIFPHASQIRFIRGRLKFSGCSNAAPFPSCIVIFSKKYTYINRYVAWEL